MAGKKTTTITNILRMNATDAKKYMRLCGQPVSESDKLHYMGYSLYGIDDDGFLVNISESYQKFALIPEYVTVEQAATAYTASDGRELALLQRLIDAGIASEDERERYDALKAKANGDTTKANYWADSATGHTVYDTDEVGKLLTPLTLS